MMGTLSRSDGGSKRSYDLVETCGEGLGWSSSSASTVATDLTCLHGR